MHYRHSLQVQLVKSRVFLPFQIAVWLAVRSGRQLQHFIPLRWRPCGMFLSKVQVIQKKLLLPCNLPKNWPHSKILSPVFFFCVQYHFYVLIVCFQGIRSPWSVGVAQFKDSFLMAWNCYAMSVLNSLRHTRSHVTGVNSKEDKPGII